MTCTYVALRLGPPKASQRFEQVLGHPFALCVKAAEAALGVRATLPVPVLCRVGGPAVPLRRRGVVLAQAAPPPLKKGYR